MITGSHESSVHPGILLKISKIQLSTSNHVLSWQLTAKVQPSHSFSNLLPYIITTFDNQPRQLVTHILNNTNVLRHSCSLFSISSTLSVFTQLTPMSVDQIFHFFNCSCPQYTWEVQIGVDIEHKFHTKNKILVKH